MFGLEGIKQMTAKKLLEFHCFSIVVVRYGRRFLMVRERKHGQKWYLPAGRLEHGETFQQGAIRETREESGLNVVLEGVLRIEITPPLQGPYYRQRVIFVARPSDDMAPKTQADEETLGAAWFTLEEARSLPLRGQEVISLFEYIERGESIYPLQVITYEGSTWV